MASFQTIEIYIGLNDQMESDLPTTSEAETVAIDNHSDVIDRAIEAYLDAIKTDLEALGYVVTVDTCV